MRQRTHHALAALTLALAAAFGRPANADPFDPEVRHRPRLMLEADDLATVRARIGRAPYDSWMSGLRALSQASPAPYEGYDPSRESANGNIAKAAAFTALVDDDVAAASRARDVLLVCEDSVPNLTLNPLLIGEDIHLAEGIMAYAQAADLLFATGALSPSDSIAVHDRLATLARSTYQRYVKGNPLQYHLMMNNHRSKLAAAMGMAGLALNEDEDASIWVDWGMTVVDDILRYQTVEEDGTYGEGPDYLCYSAVNHLPFAYAYHLFRDGAGGVFTYRRYGIFGQIVVSEERELENPLISDLYAAIDDWGVAIRRFDGLRSPFDDANPIGYFGFFGAVVRDDPILAWDWWEADALKVEDVNDLRADAICVADDGQARVQPTGSPTVFLPAGGHAILREGWEHGDMRVHILAEHDDSRVAGGLHEHADATSFMIEAHSEPLAIDSGYGRWEDRLLVHAAENHNLILVDGKGPPAPELIPPVGVDAAQDLEADTDRIDAVRVAAGYRDSEVLRIVAAFDHRWVAVLDRIAADQGSHDFEWVLHGNGGGSTGGSFALTGDGARWDRAGGSLVAHVAAAGSAPLLGAEEMSHGLVWGSMETHMALRAVTTGPSTAFATLLDLPAAGEEEAIATDLSRPGAALLLCRYPDGIRALLSSREDRSAMSLGPLRFDGFAGLFVGLFLGREPQSPQALLATECTEVSAFGRPILASDIPIDLAVSWAEDRTTLHLQDAQGASIELWVGCALASLDGPVDSWSNLPGGLVSFTPSDAAVDLALYCE